MQYKHAHDAGEALALRRFAAVDGEPAPDMGCAVTPCDALRQYAAKPMTTGLSRRFNTRDERSCYLVSAIVSCESASDAGMP